MPDTVRIFGRTYTLIDISDRLSNDTSAVEPMPHHIDYLDHVTAAAGRDPVTGGDVVWPDGLAGAGEKVTLTTHAGTHVDAPYHYGPLSGGRPARTVDETPLSWFFGDAFLLDVSHKRAGDGITDADVRAELERIEYDVRPGDIALVRTDASKRFGEPGYQNMHPGLRRSATELLVRSGVRLIGIDAWGLDRPFDVMIPELQAGDTDQFWESHRFGREMEYCQIERLTNLAAIPVAHGFLVAAFPVKIARASGAWTRAVAFVPDEKE
jgi:kynurenine formamidase